MNILFEMLGAAFLLVLGVMAILWIVYCIQKRGSLVDIGWAFSFTLAAWAYCFFGEGNFLKKWVITLLVTFWSLRLTWHLLQRYLAFGENGRYKALDEDRGKFLILFIFQGVVAIVLTLPFLIISAFALSGWSGIEAFGILLSLVGIVGEAFADQQLFRFKQNPDNRDKVCQVGLWYYSRHPNYFFEFISWCGFFFFALGTPGGWISLIAPLLMLYLLTQVSGIPLAEAEALKTKGEAYAEYQKTTSAFIPWFR